MKGFKTKLISGIFALTFLLGSAIGVLAAYSGTISVSLDPWGGSKDNFTYITKTTSSSTFSVYGVYETNTLNPYVRLMNANGEGRSGWCKVQQGLTNSVYDNNGTVGYLYRTRAKSNNLEPNYTTISYQFDPK